ncbi:GNAT family N-acetyltransferase [Salinisphaera orenii]|uniref:GNAT family N-acetyltransferase n=1 Tax=Salinisphaera orenii TaxID=856731 RepID=UPI001C835FB4|nr:GNAT family N-acetyltransferase [Salinisphaera halophila]
MIEVLAYSIKYRFPVLFRAAEKVARVVTTLRFGARIRRARSRAGIHGAVRDRCAVMHPLDVVDINHLCAFIESLPQEHLRYFKPHRFDRASLQEVLRSQAFLSYGLFVDNRLVGYALLKTYPTGTAFIGRVIHPDYAGMGLGSFLARYLYWQASLANLRARSTISRHNTASLASHRAVADYRVVAELPNEYLLVEFCPLTAEPPELSIS